VVECLPSKLKALGSVPSSEKKKKKKKRKVRYYFNRSALYVSWFDFIKAFNILSFKNFSVCLLSSLFWEEAPSFCGPVYLVMYVLLFHR